MKYEHTLEWANNPCRCFFLCFCGSKDKASVLRAENARLLEVIADHENFMQRVNGLTRDKHNVLENHAASLEKSLSDEKSENAGRVKALEDMKASLESERAKLHIARDRADTSDAKCQDIIGKANALREHILKFSYKLHPPDMRKHIDKALSIEFK